MSDFDELKERAKQIVEQEDACEETRRVLTELFGLNRQGRFPTIIVYYPPKNVSGYIFTNRLGAPGWLVEQTVTKAQWSRRLEQLGDHHPWYGWAASIECENLAKTILEAMG